MRCISISLPLLNPAANNIYGRLLSVYVYVYVYVYTCICMCMCMHVHVYAHAYVYVYVYVYVHMCVHVYENVYAYAYIHMHVYIYIYIYIYRCREGGRHRCKGHEACTYSAHFPGSANDCTCLCRCQLETKWPPCTTAQPPARSLHSPGPANMRAWLACEGPCAVDTAYNVFLYI